MSTTTDVLSLFKYDPVADADSTFNITQGLNNNWDKLDAALLLSIAAAGAYNPEESYAVGDYCTYKGKLRKCSTAIPTGETWTEAHWTTTTVAAEMQELSSQLSNLAGAHPITTFIGLASIGFPSNIPITTADICAQMPLSAELFEGISASSQPEITDIPFSNSTLHIVKLSNPRCYCICIDRDNRGVQIATWKNSAFSGWKPFATATKPQEFDLPLVEGITGYAKYSKDQFGRVLVMLQDIARSDGAALAVNEITVISTIPAGFRPHRDIYLNGVATGTLGSPILGTYQIWVYATGQVCCLAESGISPMWLRGELWYTAAD